ncbi:unnamed protein product [Lactuca saligna]|uniref:Transmembrane protein n=1 Tax=Lactuca saligna TaxID=75948 RepID=A0AA35YVD0_LACSI|nr:unnamed protein product [Lactuca saligna]
MSENLPPNSQTIICFSPLTTVRCNSPSNVHIYSLIRRRSPPRHTEKTNSKPLLVTLKFRNLTHVIGIDFFDIFLQVFGYTVIVFISLNNIQATSIEVSSMHQYLRFQGLLYMKVGYGLVWNLFGVVLSSRRLTTAEDESTNVHQ